MVILKEKICFSIVLYRENFEHSATFVSLLNSILSSKQNQNSKITILLFDNTPNQSNKNKSFHYKENVEVFYLTENQNMGLAHAYNVLVDKAKELKKEWIVLLDQDTSLPKDFYTSYIAIDEFLMIHCPLVFSNKKLMSPSKYINYRSSRIQIPTSNQISSKNVSCINSGLLINVDFFLKIGGYNSNLFLDFCDHDFIEKSKLNQVDQFGIINCKLEQDFSAINHTKDQALDRYELFLEDLAQFYKGRNKITVFFFVDLPRVVRLILKYKTIKPLIKRIKI